MTATGSELAGHPESGTGVTGAGRVTAPDVRLPSCRARLVLASWPAGSAMVDRPVPHAEILSLKGDNYRQIETS